MSQSTHGKFKKEIIDHYTQKFGNSEDHWDWLENDLAGWMNDDKALQDHPITNKLESFLLRLNITFEKFLKNKDTHTMANNILNVMHMYELKNFCEKKQICWTKMLQS